MTQDHRFLYAVLRANAGFSGLSGLTMAVFPGPIAGFLGVQSAGHLLFLTGVGLIGFAATIIYFSARNHLTASFVLTIIAADSIWVLGTLVAILGDLIPFSGAGVIAVGFVGIVVGSFAIFQLIGWLRLRAVQADDGSPLTEGGSA